MGKAGAMVLAAGFLLVACGPSDAVLAQRARLDAEQAARMEALETVEARLQSLESRRVLWNELESRHQRVSEIACENVAGHVAEMEQHEQRFRERVAAGKHRRVARLEADEELTPTSATVSD
jgi:hypothetical protein